MYDEHHDHKIMKDCFKTTLLLQRTLYKIQSSTRALNNEQPNGKKQTHVLYTNIDPKLRNKSHRPMHCKIGVTCIYNGLGLYTLL